MRLWTDGSVDHPVHPRYQDGELAGGGAVLWTDDGHLRTMAFQYRARNSGWAEVEALHRALAGVAENEPIIAITDCVRVVGAWKRGHFRDPRLERVVHFSEFYECWIEPAELRLAHRLANWARKGCDPARRPDVRDFAPLVFLARALARKDVA